VGDYNDRRIVVWNVRTGSIEATLGCERVLHNVKWLNTVDENRFVTVGENCVIFWLLDKTKKLFFEEVSDAHSLFGSIEILNDNNNCNRSTFRC